jgi:hypothetical protein
MGRVLALVSPLEHGNDVAAFQRALTARSYYHGEITGKYDELTAQAAYRAKYWLGYAKPDHIAGDRLYGYLKGATRTPLMVLTAKRRRRALSNTPLRFKALTHAMKYKGVTESPSGSNHTQFGVWYGMDHVPWCDIFVSFNYVAVGSKAFARGSRYSYVPTMANDARAGANHLSIAHPVMPGDVITFDWDNDGVPDHTGFFVKWLNKTEGKFATLEGNTSGSNNSNGGEVMYREDRALSEVHSFIHVGA